MASEQRKVYTKWIGDNPTGLVIELWECIKKHGTVIVLERDTPEEWPGSSSWKKISNVELLVLTHAGVPIMSNRNDDRIGWREVKL